MAVDSQYTDSESDFKIQEQGTFTPIGILASVEVERLREKRNAAWDSHLWEAAETYHEQLVAAQIEEGLAE